MSPDPRSSPSTSSLHWCPKMRMPASSGERKDPAVVRRRRPDRTVQPRFGRSRGNAFPIFGLLATNRPLRRTENPRVDGSIPSLVTISNFLIRNGFRASPADYREVGGSRHPLPRLPIHRVRHPATLGRSMTRERSGESQPVGVYQIGDVHPRSWIDTGSTFGTGTPSRTASMVLQRGVGISRTRT